MDKVAETLILNGERIGVDDMVRFWKEKPDPDFSPEHNDDVVKRSIARAEKHRAEMRKLQGEGLAERADALTSFIMYQKHGGVKNADNYFGRKEMARLQGKKVIQMLQHAKETGKPYWNIVSKE